MDSRTILVVGSANIDLVTRVARCPMPGETLIGQSFTTICGGKGANQAVAAARLGARTYFAGCVGNDPFGEMQRRGLEREGIDISHLKTHPTDPTGTAVIFVGDDGENTIVVTPAANWGITPADIERMDKLITRCDALLVQLEIPLETVEAALDAARRHGVLSSLDCGPAQQVPERLVEKADIVSPNETEAQAMTGIEVRSVDSARIAARHLIEMGAREVVLKLGARGVLYMNEEDWLHVPAFEVDAVDTTAAGDAFAGALAIAWRSMASHEAIRFANATGALAATVLGAQPSLPTRDAVEAFLKSRER